MSFELFVASRYLFAKRKQAFIYVISVMAILGVALGVAALVVVLGVYNGMTTDMRDKILGANAHGVILSFQQQAFGQAPRLAEKAIKVPGLTGLTPFIYSEGM
ncbi:MAG: ABC transporter permease, partial [Desulfovibrio sp.]|nr:ABC transporter permease [Desulfovibrio sp.]